jgi:chromosome partitioning protein
MFYTAHKLAQILSCKNAQLTGQDVLEKNQELNGPTPRKGRGGIGWDSQQVCAVSEGITSLRSPNKPIVISVFVTKGGVLKTTLTLNLARFLALNGIKTLVIGLDLQGDITTALGHQISADEEDLQAALIAADSQKGLHDYFNQNTGLNDILLNTDLAHLQLIPETPELLALEQSLLLKPRREYWLSEKVLAPLSQQYQVILLDCSPNWNQLTTNALVGSDLLVSPVECRINNYRNLKMFRALVAQCMRDLDLSFQHIFVPTRMNPLRRLSREIGSWYQSHLPGCLTSSIRESVQGEEATAMNLSLPEFAPDSAAGQEMLQVLREIWRLALSQRREYHQLPKEPLWPSASIE